MMKDTTDIFENAPVPKAVLYNAIPAIISMLMVLVYNLADTFFIGQTKNALMVAAVSIATPVFLLFLAVGILFGIGGTSFISRMLGEGRKEFACKASSFCFWAGLGIGVVSAVLIAMNATGVCMAVGASEDTIGYAKEYLMIVAVGIPFLIIGNTFSNIIRAEGNAKVAMMGMVIGNIVNIVLDPIMILVLDWNVAGAAIATVLGNVISALYYMKHLMSKQSMLSIRLKHFTCGSGIAAGVFAIGVPACLNSVLMSVSNIFINNLMSLHGDMAVAGLGVAMKVNMIAVMLLIGLGSGIQPLLGYCYGAGNKKRYMDVLKFSLILAFGISMVMTIICYLGAGPLVSVFLEDKNAFTYGMSFARIYIYSGPILGILFVFMNAIQSTGAMIPALVLSISRQGILYLPTLFTFHGMFGTAETLAMAQPVTDYLATLLAFILFVITARKYFNHMK